MIRTAFLRSLKPGVTSPLKCQVRSMAYGRKVPFEPPTLSELPVPEGSWQANYNASNRKSTKHLIMGVSFFLITQFVAFRSGLITLNYKPPPLEGDGSDDDDEDCNPTPKKC